MLKITRDLSLEEVEAGLGSISQGEYLLSVPNTFKPNAAGTEIGLLQMLITWGYKARKEARLRLHVSAQDADGQKKFVETPAGLLAATLAGKVESNALEAIDRYKLLEVATDFVATMANGPLETLRDINASSSLPIMCFDGGTRYRRPFRLYDPGTDRVRSRADFNALASNGIATLMRGRQFDTSGFVAEAGELLYETFLNTHEHALQDAEGNFYRKSVRGIFFNYRYVDGENMSFAAGDSLPLRTYYSDWRTRFVGGKRPQFIEVGILDSGPGLARRWLWKDRELVAAIPPGDHVDVEYEAVHSCLLKGATTKTGGNNGNGLFRVMQATKRLGGLIRIRTGNLSLMRAFDDAGGALKDDDLRLVDVVTGKPSAQRHEWADGTAISVLFPVNRAMSS